MYLLDAGATSDTGFKYAIRIEFVFRTKSVQLDCRNWVNYTPRQSQFDLLKTAK